MKTEQTALQTIAEAARCPEYDPPMVKATPLGSDGAVAPSDFSSDETNRRRLY